MTKNPKSTNRNLLVRVDPDVKKQARITAIDLEFTLSKFVEEALFEKIARHQYQLPNQPNTDDDEGDTP